MKFTCYPISGPPPKIRPASPERDWMDATSDRYAYRCLPLSIANASGWEVLNPKPFKAVWDGRAGIDAIKIKTEDGKPCLATSHFGSGVLTFHVLGLFETPPDVQLWVGGSPNRLKDAIQPLTGVIETDWSPYTFTMNWKFTRAGQVVRFQQDEPFCFVMPIRLGLAEDAVPEFRSIDENPDLRDNYAAWSQSRKSFIKDLKQPDSEARKAKWQKRYHQGGKPDGTKAETQHRTKVRLKAFVDKTVGERDER
ncbi:MAG: DUF6065 family protein [Pseudomonadota bacterium]